LAEERFGAEVIGVDRSPRDKVAGRRHVQADLSTQEGMQQVAELIRTWRPTVLVNNASTNQSRLVADTPPVMADEIITVGFTTPFMLMREMARVHADTGGDTWVVNIVSPYRLIGVRTHSLYCATKSALSRAGESLGVELAPGSSLAVVSVVPGAFNSGFRPLEPNDAWLVRAYRTWRRRTPAQVAADLVRRLERGTRRRHRTIRVGWDGWVFEVIARIGGSDVFLAALDLLIGQRGASPAAVSDHEPVAAVAMHKSVRS
jgi:short-subunit dehydrogenase